MLKTVERHCIEWEQSACSLLHDIVGLLNEDVACDGNFCSLIPKLGSQIHLLGSIIEAGVSLKFEFPAISKLQDAHSTLQWCFKVLSFSDLIPKLEVSGI